MGLVSTKKTLFEEFTSVYTCLRTPEYRFCASLNHKLQRLTQQPVLNDSKKPPHYTQGHSSVTSSVLVLTSISTVQWFVLFSIQSNFMEQHITTRSNTSQHTTTHAATHHHT